MSAQSFPVDSFVEVISGAWKGRQGAVRGHLTGFAAGPAVQVEFATGKFPIPASHLKAITAEDTRAALNRGAVQRAIKGGRFNV